MKPGERIQEMIDEEYDGIWHVSIGTNRLLLKTIIAYLNEIHKEEPDFDGKIGVELKVIEPPPKKYKDLTAFNGC